MAGNPFAPGSTNASVGILAGFRNRAINGAQAIDVRNAGGAVTVNGTANFYLTDAFQGSGQATDGVFTAQQVADAPPGFKYSLKATVTTADASIGSTQIYALLTKIEGQNIIDFAYGTTSANTITISFWAKSSLTGVMGASISNSAFNRSYPFSYMINSANTWEYKTVTIVGDTTGTWLTDNGIGLRLGFALGAGSSYLGAPNSWQATTLWGVIGQTQVIATNGATLNITGVQVELGSIATTFETRPFLVEQSLCYRYLPVTNLKPYNIGMAYGATTAFFTFDFPVQARVIPTGMQFAPGSSGLANCYVYGSTFTPQVLTGGSLTFNTAGFSGAMMTAVSPSSIFTAGNATMLASPGILWTGSDL